MNYKQWGKQHGVSERGSGEQDAQLLRSTTLQEKEPHLARSPKPGFQHMNQPCTLGTCLSIGTCFIMCANKYCASRVHQEIS